MTSLPRYCGQCGTEWQSESAQFCANCGQERSQPTASTTPATSEVPAHPITPPRPYLSPSTRSTWTLIFLAAFVVTLIANFVVTIMDIDLLQRISDGESVTFSELESADDREVAVGIFGIIVGFSVVIAFCFWIHRAASNLDALQIHNRRFTPGWAVGWWFIPFMNLVRPYQVVKEIWQGSYPIATGDGAEGLGRSRWLFAPVSPAIGWWWGSWLTSIVVNVFVSRAISDEESSIDTVITAEYFSLAGIALSFIATVLVFQLVKGITANQEAKYLGLRNPAAP